MATTFTVSTGDKVRPWGKSELKYYPEAASQTFKRGEPLILGGAGVENACRVASDNPTSAIIGIAAEDASGTTGTRIGVYMAKPELKFLIRTVASDPVDFTDIGSARAIQAHASLSGVWVVDTTDAGNDSVVIEEYRNPITMELQTTEGDSEVYAVVHFDPKACVFGAGT